MRIHILGICGTFMAGLAIIAKAKGHTVEGSDADVYPPMSDVLDSEQIAVFEGYTIDHFRSPPDLVLVGNVISRGHEMMEYILEQNIPFTSGPEWLAREVLHDRWVLAVAGTHGKTTTTALLAWILDQAGHNPSYLIGGMPLDFDKPARLTNSPFFVIEADEYDTAFFDKRPKFMHYHPLSLILNNLEYDHVDIFDDIGTIEKQFHYLVRTVPRTGNIIVNGNSDSLHRVLGQGCWSECQYFYLDAANDTDAWRAVLLSSDGVDFELHPPKAASVNVHWSLAGKHNVSNALGAAIAANHVGVRLEDIAHSLSEFRGVHRRMELLGEVDGVMIYEDFAHHPTAISSTLETMRAQVGVRRLFVALELRSATMLRGVHRHTLKESTQVADRVLWYQPENLEWDLPAAVSASGTTFHSDVDAILVALSQEVQKGDYVVTMSNGSFEGLPYRLLEVLRKKKQ